MQRAGRKGEHMAVPAVQVQGTPNPNAAKFVLDRSVLGDEGRTYFDAESAEPDALASRLFGIAGVRALFMVDNFITVTKSDEASWDDMVEAIRTSIQEELGK
jgi:NFU1 iron-sulfur cluster scaffold homolog, mitochondrial